MSFSLSEKPQDFHLAQLASEIIPTQDLRIIEIAENDLERCKPFYDVLMQFQAEKSNQHSEILAAMNFENRLKPSFLGSDNKRLLLAEYQGEGIGYAFANTYFMEESERNYLPEWLEEIYEEGHMIFYPEKQKFPAHIGVLKQPLCSSRIPRQGYRI